MISFAIKFSKLYSLEILKVHHGSENGKCLFTSLQYVESSHAPYQRIRFFFKYSWKNNLNLAYSKVWFLRIATLLHSTVLILITAVSTPVISKSKLYHKKQQTVKMIPVFKTINVTLWITVFVGHIIVHKQFVCIFPFWKINNCDKTTKQKSNPIFFSPTKLNYTTNTIEATIR
jgi:uncharacterized membrane protein